MSTKDILEIREKTHGDFSQNAMCSQKLKNTIKSFSNENEHKFTPCQREALDMICSKVARICVGDTHEVDHWVDIAGYATLVVRDMAIAK